MLRPAALATLALFAFAVPAGGESKPPTAWNGENPFQCELQQAGLKETGPNPKADPYCVEFDKRRQNITELGLAEFLLREPGRVAAAGDKCFYFQSDHWRGSIVQSDGSTKTYEFDGHYFTNQGTGDGGVWVTNFNVNGKSFDPSSIPGIPQEYAQHLGPGTGGFMTRNDFPANPACAERLRRESDRIYRTGKPPGAVAAPPACLTPSGGIATRRIGPIALGTTEGATRKAIGAPRQVKRGFLRYCLRGGGSLLVGQSVDRSGEAGSDEDDARAIMLVTSGKSHRTRGVGTGSTLAALRKALGSKTVQRLKIRNTRFFASSKGSNVLFAVRANRVRWVAVFDRRRMARTAVLREYLIRSRGL